MELTNALALDYLDPALEGHIITFTCPTGQIFNESKLTQQPVWGMENGEWEPDPRELSAPVE